MKRPEEVTLSREEGEALIERIERNALSAEDRRVLVKVLTFYFWLLFTLREAKLSLKRLKALVFGEKSKKRESPAAGGTPSGGSTGGRGPTSIGPSHGWSVGMRNWRWASGVRRVGAGGCIGCHRGLRCGWMAARCSRPCARSWKSCAVPPVGKSLRLPCRLEREQRSTVHGREPY
jgi:hypothetical protein